MKVSNEKTENRQAYLTIEMEPAEVEESLQKSYQRLVQNTRIPGFRKGKAPRAILESYIGKESLFEDTVKHLLPEAYDKAINEQEIEAIAQPQLELTQTDPLTFKAVVPLKPQVKLGDYQQIRIAAEPIEVTEDHIDSVIDQLRHQHAVWEPVERAVALHDLVVISVDSSVDGNPYITQDGAQYQVIPETPFPAPGFSEQLVGMNTNEEKEFSITFPDDHPRADLAEKEATFKVRVTEVKEELLPDLNDDFAKMVDPDFQNLSALRDKVSSELATQAEQKSRADHEEKVIEALVDISEVEFPPVLEEAEIHRILEQRFQRGNQELEEYLKYANQTEEELHEEIRPVANRRVIRSLLLGKIVDEEKIEVGDDEIDLEIANMLSSSSDKRNELERILNTPQARESIRQTLITRHCIQRLLYIASGSVDNHPETNEEES